MSWKIAAREAKSGNWSLVACKHVPDVGTSRKTGRQHTDAGKVELDDLMPLHGLRTRATTVDIFLLIPDSERRRRAVTRMTATDIRPALAATAIGSTHEQYSQQYCHHSSTTPEVRFFLIRQSH